MRSNAAVLLFLLWSAMAAGQSSFVYIGDFPLEKDYQAKRDLVAKQYTDCKKACSEQYAARHRGESGSIEKPEKIPDCGCEQTYSAKMSDIANHYSRDYASWKQEAVKEANLQTGSTSGGSSGNFADYYQTAGDSYLYSSKSTRCIETSRWYFAMYTYCKSMAAAYHNGTTLDAITKPAIGDSPPYCAFDNDPNYTVTASNPYFDPQGADEIGKSLQSELQRLQQLTREYGQGGLPNADLRILQNALSPKYPPKEMDYPGAAISSFNNAYQNALDGGQKTSGAILSATLSSANLYSDPKLAAANTAFGLGLAGIAALGEKKEEKKRKEQEAAQKEEEERRIQMEKIEVVNRRNKYLMEFQPEKMPLSGTRTAGPRVYVYCLAWNDLSYEKTEAGVSSVAVVDQYKDGTWPETRYVLSRFLKTMKPRYAHAKLVGYFNNPDEAGASAQHVINDLKTINADIQLVPFVYETSMLSTTETGVDFWGNPVKKDDKKPTEAGKTKTKEKSFWDN
ncbi:MAG TPA: hypothetical protein VGM30_05745 [Puia sp.]|jgi:hypothetical protein